MWLKYGVDEEGILICIEDINRGKTSLKCPYCHGELTAKKGKIKEHHFAHNSETCRPVANREFPTLPLYDNFNVQLSGKDLTQLKLLWKEYGVKNYPISSYLVTPGLLKAGMLRKNVYLTLLMHQIKVLHPTQQSKIPTLAAGTTGLLFNTRLQQRLVPAEGSIYRLINAA